jgi:hypothetical protein
LLRLWRKSRRSRISLSARRHSGLSAPRRRAPGAYQDFLALWKDADPDLPILKEAQAEYAKLP